MVSNTTVQDWLSGMTRTEGLALVALLEHIGVPLSLNGTTVQTPLRRGRTWTKAQRLAHGKRMKAYWRARNGK